MVGTLLQAPAHDAIESRTNRRFQVRDLRNVVLQDRGHGFSRGVTTKSPAPGHHLIQNGAERKHVGTRIDRLAAHLLRRHVAHCAHHHARGRMRGDGDAVLPWSLLGSQLCQSKIENLHAPVAADKQVVGLQVAVNDTFVVRRCQTLRDLRGVIDRLALRQCSAIEHSAKRLTFQ
jgi:hypothetical protein